MLFKVSYTRWGRPSVLYIYAESCDSALDYLTSTEGWWQEMREPDISRCSHDDPDYVRIHSEGLELFAPLGWATRTSPDLPRRYYYRIVSDINRDYTLLRWAATPAQLKLAEDWTEISRTEASKMARAAAKEDTSYYPYGWRADDDYIYPFGAESIDNDYFVPQVLHYHSRLRIADYTPGK